MIQRSVSSYGLLSLLEHSSIDTSSQWGVWYFFCLWRGPEEECLEVRKCQIYLSRFLFQVYVFFSGFVLSQGVNGVTEFAYSSVFILFLELYGHTVFISSLLDSLNLILVFVFIFFSLDYFVSFSLVDRCCIENITALFVGVFCG